MSLRIWVVNIAMAVLLLFAGINIWELWHKEFRDVSGSAGGAGSVQGVAADEAEDRLLDQQEYEMLASRNLFSPDRKVYAPAQDSEKQEAEKKPKEKTVRISGEAVALYGVVITGEKKIALINNPGGKLGDGRFIWIRKGDALANLTVADITPGEIILDEGSAQYKVSLSEKKRPKTRRQREKSSGPTVVKGGSAPQSSPSSSSTAQSKAGSKGGSASQKSSSSATSGSAEQQYKIIETPFGTIKRKIK